MKTFIANTSKDTIRFHAQDYALDMTVQALMADSTWHDIEYLPNSSCGNSYSIVALEPRHYWSFVTPQYEGEYKTKLRIALGYIDPAAGPNADSPIITLYSKEFEGGINPGQLWITEQYNANDVIDHLNYRIRF